MRSMGYRHRAKTQGNPERSRRSSLVSIGSSETSRPGCGAPITASASNTCRSTSTSSPSALTGAAPRWLASKLSGLGHYPRLDHLQDVVCFGVNPLGTTPLSNSSGGVSSKERSTSMPTRLSEVQNGLERYLTVYNQRRPQTAPDNFTPDAFSCEPVPVLPMSA